MLHHTIDACTRTALRDPLLVTKRRKRKYSGWGTTMVFVIVAAIYVISVINPGIV